MTDPGSRFSSDKTSRPLYLNREPVEGTCPACGSAELRRYPANSEGGWFNVVKCQRCLHSVQRERGPRLGYVSLLVDRI